MSRYRRSRIGQTFFFTVVSDQRRPILTTDLGRQSLREAIVELRQELPFDIVTIVLLPDHLHTIWELPHGDTDYSTRWQRIKTTFTKTWRRNGSATTHQSESRLKRGEQGVWQRRFFEHTCRDQSDLKRCVDYVHVNPLKHGLVERVCDWPWSSFHRYVEAGECSIDWGSASAWYGDEFKHFE
jgi:putative transposase